MKTTKLSHYPLTYRQAINQLIRETLPFGLSRLPVAINSVAFGVVLATISDIAVAAGPLVTTLQYLLMGTARGILLSSGIVIGKANGAERYEEVGKISRQSWLLSTFLGIALIVVFFNTKAILVGTGIANEQVAALVQAYFRYYSIGVIPTLWMICDSQLAVGVKKSHVSLAASIGYGACIAGLGIPMAFGLIPHMRTSTGGLGLGAGIAGWLTVFGLRGYYFINASFYKRFRLFSLRFKNSWHYLHEMMGLGMQLGFQVLTEWGNLTATVVVVGLLGTNALQAEQASLQYVTAFNLMILGLAQGIAALLANAIGGIEKAKERGDSQSVETHSKNIKTIGNTGIAFGVGLSAVVAVLLIAFRTSLSKIFLFHADSADFSQIQAFSETLLLTNAWGLVLDTSRNMSSGGLRGFKDIMYSTWWSFIAMTIVGVSVGATILFTVDDSPNLMFLIRNGMIFLAGCAILYRWYTYSHYSADEKLGAFKTNAQSRLRVTSSES